MTVTKGKKAYFVRPGSSQASDTEILQIDSPETSDAESLHNETIFRARSRRAPIVLDDSVHLKKASGKKKLRRFQNRRNLQTLQEEDELDNSSTLIAIVEPHKSPFAKLLEDEAALDYWNNFVRKSEEEQTAIISAFSTRSAPQTDDCKDAVPNNKTSLGKVWSKVKRTFRTKKNLSLELVKQCEDRLLAFFHNTPKEVYTVCPPTSFERLLLRAIAHYHGLQSRSVPLGEDVKPSIQVFSTNEQWVPANCFLTDFIQQLR